MCRWENSVTARTNVGMKIIADKQNKKYVIANFLFKIALIT